MLLLVVQAELDQLARSPASSASPLAKQFAQRVVDMARDRRALRSAEGRVSSPRCGRGCRGPAPRSRS